jgi:Nucleotidyltransferase/DNA polymerase involved in DNA repair
MNIIHSNNSEIKIYSINETFITINPHYTNPINYTTTLRNKIYQSTRIPISIRIRKTKTLTKIANHLSKKNVGKDNIYLINNKINQDLLQKVKIHDI